MPRGNGARDPRVTVGWFGPREAGELVDRVELVQDPIDLVTDERVDSVACDTLRDQLDQLVHAGELVGDSLELVQAEIAMLRSASSDLGASPRARMIRARARSREPVIGERSQRFDAAIVIGSQADEVVQQVLEVEPPCLGRIEAFAVLHQAAKLGIPSRL